ncbi:MocR-like pyridoxine biosynthesis transcription factor PdxR [Chitinibacter tainanensis]|uniref:MocR-like pyridoxine biosynthesis transcription factor PdxR n=1 Tax=Chitinibacter tainanensis TaxID=230667 RepID=UPI000406FF04|nr:PLP-dependent aminotransferase family protein [Chitinibacter tainanensis]
MFSLQAWLSDETAARLPRHEQISRALRAAILAGHWPAGSRLPATRQLASELGHARSTIEQAYAQLEAEGYLQRRVGAGSFVSLPASLPLRRSPSPPAAARLSQRGQAIADTGACREATLGVGAESRQLFSGQPDSQAFPHALWGKMLQQRWRQDGPALMRYGDPQGLPALRTAIASYLALARGVNCQPEQVLVLSSSQQALLLAGQLLLDAGELAWLEEPGYLGARNALLAAGAQLCPVPVDDEGLNTNGEYPKPKLIYTTPSHQYPLGMAMSLPRRMALLARARAAGAWIIEDDYDGEFQYDTHSLPALQSLDPDGRVIYVGTFSKVLFGSLRLAYMVVPANLVEAFSNARTAFDGHSNQLLQAVTADFMAGGHFASHLRQMRLLYQRRRDILLASLAEHCPALSVRHHSAGLQCAVYTPPGCEAGWTALGRAQGLPLRPLAQFYAGPPDREGWLMGYAALSNEEIRRQIDTLGCILRHSA